MGGVKEKGFCSTHPFGLDDACEAGLLCVLGRCGRPCSPDGGVRCPEGGSCTETENGWGCFPSCRQSGCGAGETCVELRDGKSVCVHQQGENCFQQPCPAGEDCRFFFSRNRGVFTCRRRCNPAVPEECSPGFVCGAPGGPRSHCYRSCNPQDPKCAEGDYCAPVNEDRSLWACVP